MATDTETLLLVLEAQTKQLDTQMKRAAAQFDSQSTRMENRVKKLTATLDKQMNSAASAMDTAFSRIGAGLAGAGAAVVAKSIADMSDAWVEAGNKISATGLGKDQANAARDAISEIAQRARSDFGATADLYARLTRAGQGFGASQGEVAVATETVAKALKLTGASAAETESTLVQLGQALTSGRLQGDELRSLSENAPVIAASIAKSFGVAVGQLKDLGAQGVLTSDRVFRAIVEAQPDVEKSFASTAATIKDGFRAIETAAIRYVGTSNSVSGSAAIMARAMGALAQNFDVVATGAAALGVVLATRLIAAGLAPVVASFGAMAASSVVANGAVGAFAAGAARASVSAASLGVALRGASGAMALLGGPIGAAIFGLVAIFTVVASKTQEGSAANRVYADALAQVEAQANKTRPAIEGVAIAVDRKARAMRDAATAAQQNNLGTFETDARNLETTIRGAVQSIEQFGAVRVSNGEKEQALAAIKAALEGDATAAIDARIRLEDLGAVNPSFAAAFAKLGQLLTSLAAVRQSAVATRAALAGVAAESAAAGERQRAAGDQAALFKAGAGAVGAPAGLDPAFKRLELQREIALSRVDDTKKRIDAKTKELYEKDRALGQALSLSEYAKAAGQIIANEEGGGGGGGGGKGGGAAKSNGFDQEIKSLTERTAALDREREALGLSAREAAKAEASQKLLDAAKQAGIPITEALRARVDELSAGYAQSKLSLDAARDAQQGFYDLQKLAGSSISGFFSDIISGGKNAAESLMNLTKKLADAALQALLLGEGPLGKIFGLSAPGGKGVGGLIGMLFGGLGGGSLPGLAVGTSNVPRDMPAMLHKGEAVIPKYDADMLRKGNTGGGGNFAVTIDVRGATGNEEIQRMVDAGFRQAVATSQKIIGRNMVPMLQNAQARFG